MYISDSKLTCHYFGVKMLSKIIIILTLNERQLAIYKDKVVHRTLLS